MDPDRHRQITDAAYALLAEKGYKATSMLAIARRAGASNETLYRHYTNKQGLFRRMVEDNAGAVVALLDTALEAQDASALDTLHRLGPLLLETVLGDRAVALNRAAVGDVHDTGTLGPTLAEAGRAAVLPRLVRLMARLELDPAQRAAETYLALLIGDLQIRRATGVMPMPDDSTRRKRADAAVQGVLRVHGGE